MSDSDDLAARLAAATEGRASAPRLRDGVLSVVLDVGGLDADRRALLEADVRGAVRDRSDVSEVRIVQTADRKAADVPPAGPRILAVGSGKGGVGKSTLAANLAVALHRMGLRVGLVDADIHGPSLPRLLGNDGTKPRAEGDRLIPIESAAGVPVLSMGHLSRPGQAIAWRGPMAGNALGQLIGADWRGVDLLVVDLPPGTGDVQLTMIQKHKPAGAVIVSTPQDLALIDAARAVSLFNQAGVPIIGLVENMAGYVCPHCGAVSDPFGHGGAQAAAAEMGLPFLGRIPLEIAIRRDSDAGAPPAAGDDASARPFHAIAAIVARWLENSRR
jgi:ATP-binding protein involved in chromosome partitioning